MLTVPRRIATATLIAAIIIATFAIAVLLLQPKVATTSPSERKAQPTQHTDRAVHFERAATQETERAANQETASSSILRHPIALATTAGLLHDFNHLSDGRPFIERNWLRPSVGGRFYASKVMDECHGVRILHFDILSMSQPDIAVVGELNYVRAGTALQLLQARCGQLTADDYTRFSGPVAFGDPTTKDILVEASKAISRLTKSPQTRLEAIQVAMDVGDPLLIQDIGKRLALYSSTTDGIYYYFNGKKYPVAGEEDFSAAFLLVPCGLGLDCGAHDTQLALRCLSGQGCYADRYEMVRKAIANDDSERYAAILSTYAELLVAFRTKTASSLAPPQ